MTLKNKEHDNQTKSEPMELEIYLDLSDLETDVQTDYQEYDLDLSYLN